MYLLIIMEHTCACTVWITYLTYIELSQISVWVSVHECGRESVGVHDFFECEFKWGYNLCQQSTKMTEKGDYEPQ